MSGPIVGLVGFAICLALIGLGVPVAVALAVVGIIGFGILNGFGSAMFVLGTSPFEAVQPYTLSVIPLFIMMGVFAARCGLSTDLFKAANAIVGRLRGGLAIATIGACAGFGAICGSSLATVATIGRVALPEMRAAGYDDRLSCASIASAGTLAVMIPPSIILIIYGLLTEQSIGKLFSAAIMPGLLATALYIAAVIIQLRLNPALAKMSPAKSWRERGADLVAAWPVAAMFLIVIGGIQIGLFSPTEAAAVGAAGAVLLAVLRGALDGRTLFSAMRETVEMTGMIFMILVGAALFNAFMETTGLPQYLVGLLQGTQMSAYTILIIIMIFYLFLGCFMDSMSMILLTIPFVYPIIKNLGFDPIWFGVLIVTVAELGLISPPVGMNLFVMQGVAPDISSRTVMSGVLPFLAADCVRLAILIAFPAITLWLPSMAG